MKMKLYSLTLILANLLLLAFCTVTYAGTAFVGIKGWYAIWDSFTGQSIKPFFESYGIGVDVENGKGYMAGPLFGYQSDDKLWSISVAYMALSNFKQSIALDLGPGFDTEKLDAKLKKIELDIALSYSLSNNLKAFAGYKYQDYEQELNTSMGDKLTFSISGNFPTIGIGFVYPLTDTITTNVQAGALYGFYSDLKYSDLYESGTLKLKNKPGFNIEGGMNFILSESLILQTAIRYQYLKVETEMSVDEGGLKGTDKFYGFTIGLVYVFPIQ